MTQFPLDLLPTTPVDLSQLDKRDELKESMAIVHNMFIRHLNSIYLNADKFDPKMKSDLDDFLEYITAFVDTLSLHHQVEERFLFPRLMKDIPEMSTNVDEHAIIHAFLDELSAFVKEDNHRYTSSKLREILTRYGDAVHHHLSSELDTLDPTALRRVISNDDLTSLTTEMLLWARDRMDPTSALPMSLSGHDKATSAYWPTLRPGFDVAGICAPHKGAWRFAPYDPVTREPQVFVKVNDEATGKL